MVARRAVFLDRDGVINPYHFNSDFGTMDSPATPEQFQLLPGVAEAIAALNSRNFAVIVASNQPGVARGKVSVRLLQAITVKMAKLLDDGGARLDDVLYCTHDPHAPLPQFRADCECRKPKPGMLLRSARERNLDLSGSFMVGDGVDDMAAGRAAGVTSVLLGGRRCSLCEEFALREALPDRIARDLPQAVQIILGLAAGRRRFSYVPGAVRPCLLATAEAVEDCAPAGDKTSRRGGSGVAPASCAASLEDWVQLVDAARQFAASKLIRESRDYPIFAPGIPSR